MNDVVIVMGGAGMTTSVVEDTLLATTTTAVTAERTGTDAVARTAGTGEVVEEVAVAKVKNVGLRLPKAALLFYSERGRPQDGMFMLRAMSSTRHSKQNRRVRRFFNLTPLLLKRTLSRSFQSSWR